MWNIFSIVNRIKEIVSFELGNEIYKIEIEKNSEWPGDSEIFLCPTLLTRQKTSFSISLPRSRLPSLLFYLQSSVNMTLSTLLVLAVCRIKTTDKTTTVRTIL